MNNRVPRRPNFCIALIITFAILALNLTPVANAQGAATRVETFSLAPDGQVRVENLRGATSIEVWNEDSVRVVAERKTPPSLALDASDVVLMSAQNTVIIQCRQSSKPGRIDLTDLSSCSRAHSIDGRHLARRSQRTSGKRGRRNDSRQHLLSIAKDR